MNKKLLTFALIAVLVILSIATIVAVAKTDLARFEVKNKTDLPVSISLINGDTFYYLFTSYFFIFPRFSTLITNK